MDHFQQIYRNRAADYHRMIAAEDVDGQILGKLQEVADLGGRRVLDLGTGTGRLPLLLAGEAGHFTGLDLSRAMLRQNQDLRDGTGGRWDLVEGDMRRLPFPPAWAEITTAGWAIGHLRGWYADWRNEIGQVLQEMHRVTVPGGCLIVFETLGTGSLAPAPPTPGLAEYYAWLEGEWGFTRHTIATDYQFASSEEAAAQTEFFFGPELAASIRAQGWSRLPEWTGVWVKRL